MYPDIVSLILRPQGDDKKINSFIIDAEIVGYDI